MKKVILITLMSIASNITLADTKICGSIHSIISKGQSFSAEDSSPIRDAAEQYLNTGNPVALFHVIVFKGRMDPLPAHYFKGEKAIAVTAHRVDNATVDLLKADANLCVTTTGASHELKSVSTFEEIVE